MANKKSKRGAADDAWMRGFATATAIAARCFQADGMRILGEGGFTIADLEAAGVEDYDLDGVRYGRDKPEPEPQRPALWRQLTGPQQNLLRHLARKAPHGLEHGKGWTRRTAEVLMRNELATLAGVFLHVTPKGTNIVMPVRS